MRILFTSPVLEHPAAGGPQLRIENSIKALSQIADLDILSRSPPSMAGAESEKFFRSYCKEFRILPSAQNISANQTARRLQKIFGLLAGSVDKDARLIVDHAASRNIKLIWFGFGNISWPLMRRVKQMNPNLKLICDTDSVWSRFILRELPYAKGLHRLKIKYLGQRKEREEKAWTNLCDVTTAVSEVDADYYRSFAKDPSRVHVFSNVIDVASYANPPASPPGFHKPSIYLAGTFGHYHSPMDVAARWMLDEVLPILRLSEPNIHFYIVGNNSDKMFGHLQDPNITVTGKLPSVLPYLCNVDVALVPLKFESGTRFKILEAGACKVPIVSTTLGAEGIPVRHENDILLADDAQGFAAAILRLLQDKALATRLAANGYNLVSRSYSVEALVTEAQRIMGYLRV